VSGIALLSERSKWVSDIITETENKMRDL
jgi:hypothetical protein